MLRQIYYWLPPSWRYWARQIVYWPIDLCSSDTSMPPQRLIYTGRGDFVKQGAQWLSFFRHEASLQPSDEVLDIGSGIGRIALPLTSYLQAGYHGFDAVKQGIDWCQKNISSKYPHFQFTHIDLANDLYKAKGIDASKFVFPYATDSFNFICAISVYTHMLPAELENYIQNCILVSKPNAKMVFTFFVLNAKSMEQMYASETIFKFVHFPDSYYALMNNRVKSANVAYQEEYLDSLFTKNGLTIVKKVEGHWSSGIKSDDLAFQDIWIIQK